MWAVGLLIVLCFGYFTVWVVSTLGKHSKGHDFRSAESYGYDEHGKVKPGAQRDCR